MSEVLSDRYFSPVKMDVEFQEGTIGEQLKSFREDSAFPDISQAKVVLIGVPEDRGGIGNRGSSSSPDQIRRELYKLYPDFPVAMLADLGNLTPGDTITDTYAALSEVLASLMLEHKIPVILGGSQDLTIGNYLAYERLEQTCNLTVVDARLDLRTNGEVLNPDHHGWLTNILLRQPNFLFNYSLLGYQTYYTRPENLMLLDKLYFDSFRLGQLKGRLIESEPVIRNADFVSFDMGAIRFADAPGNEMAGPNGFTGEEACQMMRYAGMSDKLTSIGIYEGNTLKDQNNVTSALAAQMVWYFLEGVYNRKEDFPVADMAEYLRYRVVLKDHKNEIIFYKSGRSERWWMDVPYPRGNRMKFQRHHLVPCTYEDYLTACRDEMPDRWWRTWQKLS